MVTFDDLFCGTSYRSLCCDLAIKFLPPFPIFACFSIIDQHSNYVFDRISLAKLIRTATSIHIHGFLGGRKSIIVLHQFRDTRRHIIIYIIYVTRSKKMGLKSLGPI